MEILDVSNRGIIDISLNGSYSGFQIKHAFRKIKKSTLDYIFILTVLKKQTIGCGGSGELIFYIQEIWSLLFIVFSSQSGQIGIFKRDWKNIYKKNIVYSNQTYCVKISWIVYRMKIEAVVFRIV